MKTELKSLKLLRSSLSDYLFGWTYDATATLPLHTFMSCTWEAGVTHPNGTQFNLTNPLAVGGNHVYNIAHNFSVAGEHTVRCNMSNFVGYQVLTYNVCESLEGFDFVQQWESVM